MTPLSPRPLSYSSLKLFETCERKWWFRYVKKLKEPENRGTAFGSALHVDLQHYLTTGDLPQPGRNRQLIARALALDLLPEPGTVAVEQKFNVPFGNTTLIGSIDINATREADISVVDHKSGRDPKWRLTEEQLQQDVQVQLYLKVAGTLADWKPETYTAQHIWYRSEGPISVHGVGPVEFTHEQIEKTWAEKLSIVPYLQLVDGTDDVTMIPGNRRACDDFGGCPYRSTCNMFQYRLQGENNMTNLEKLKAARAQQVASQSKSEPTPTPLPTPTEVEEARQAISSLNEKAKEASQILATMPVSQPPTQSQAEVQPATPANPRPRILLLTSCVTTSPRAKYLDDIMRPVMDEIQRQIGVPYFADKFKDGAKKLAVGFEAVADTLKNGDIVVVRGDISWTPLVVEQLRARFDVVDIIGVR